MAWTPPSLPDSIVLLGGLYRPSETQFTAEIVPGKKQAYLSLYLFFPGGATFSLPHETAFACGIPDGETIVMTGAGAWESHSYVTRQEDAKSQSPDPAQGGVNQGCEG